jgi:hypothetical protein
MANRPIFPGVIKNAALDIENADGTTIQDLVVAGANGSRIDAISVTSDDTVDIDLIVYYHDGTNDFIIARVTVTAGAGTNGTVQAISLLNKTNMPFLGEDLSYYLESTDKLRIAAQAAVTAAKKISLVAIVGDY